MKADGQGGKRRCQEQKEELEKVTMQKNNAAVDEASVTALQRADRAFNGKGKK